MRLSGDVFLNPLTLFSQKRTSIHAFPFDAERALYFYLGRTAIWHGVNALGLKKDDEVLIPSYNCGSEVEPLMKYGLKLTYYEIDDLLNLRIEEVKKKITSKTKALYITHFFGFAQPLEEIQKMCKERELFLFEDCAHSLFSSFGDRPLGSYGDVSIFSFRKSLPIPDGGVLVINNPEIEYPIPQTYNPWIYRSKDLLYLINGHYVYSSGDPGLLHLIMGKISDWRNNGKGLDGDGYEKRQLHDEKITMYPEYAYFWPQIEKNYGISGVSQKILNSVSPHLIVSKRRENFKFLLSSIKGISQLRPIFNELPTGVCPLVFPVLVEDRESLRVQFRKKDIALGRWWQFFHEQVPWENFPEAVRLKNHLVSIPVHQDVSIPLLEKLVEELRAYYKI